ncbi:MAG TPA: hypothetical protein VMV57_02155 [Terracidiphilus sp.]|nr:hypothetical protein [Terracidiphilus sp.]
MKRKRLSLRSLRMIWVVSLVYAAVVVCFAEFMSGASKNQFAWPQWSVAALGIWTAWSGYSLRRKFMMLAARSFSAGATDTGGRRWSVAQLFGIASAESVVLWGLIADMVLKSPRFLGGFLYAAGMIILILYRPTNPPTTASS